MSTIFGSVGNDTLVGTASKDTIKGVAGDDVINAGAGDDSLDGGVGLDIMVGGLGNDIYVVDNAGDVVNENAGEGTDLVNAGVSYTLQVNLENLTLTGTTAINGTGNALNNRIQGNSGVNTLDGAAGDDYLYGAAGADTLIGGTGNDIFVVDVITDVVIENGGEGTDTVQAGLSYTLGADIENLSLTGSGVIGTGNTSDNSIYGNAGANTLVGLAGNDTLNGGSGSDILIGGAGDDAYVIDSMKDRVSENAGEGNDTVLAGLSYVLSENIENLTLTGTSAVNGTGNADINILRGNTGNNILNGMAGADTMMGGKGNDTYIVDDAGDVVSEMASEGTDTINAGATTTLGANIENLLLTGAAAVNGTGNALDNALTGNSAANTLDGGLGRDKMIGGGGDDVYLVDNAGDFVSEGTGLGNDVVYSSVSYALGLNVEQLVLTGAAVAGTGNVLNNILTGNALANTLSGGTGADTLAGGDGNDTYIVDNTGDVISEASGQGVDSVQSAVNFTLGTDIENLTLTGTVALIGTGNALDNLITGNTKNNILTGDAGNDTLNGGTGIDTLIGGAGDDTYVVDVAGDIVSEQAGGGIDTVQSGISYVLGAEIENLTLTGILTANATGNALDNTLAGNAATNTLDGGGGADAMAGGAGNDTYVVDDAGDTVTELASAGTDTVRAAVTYTLAANLENLVLTGTGDLDAIGNSVANALTGNTSANTLDGGAGADTLAGGAGDDVYIVDSAADVISEKAAEGSDTIYTSITYALSANVENMVLTGNAAIDLTGNTADNSLTGNSAANTLNGGGGADVLAGGDGDDVYIVDSATDTVVENAGEGIDTVQSAASYTLGANVENLVLTGTAAVNGTGNALDNAITGNSGNNTLDGGIGSDTMAGGTGNDVYIIDDAGDVVIEAASAGTDTVQTNSGATLALDLENLVLTGAADIDGTGNAVANSLTGNSGANTLDGGAGADALAGGAGDDTYVIDNAGDTVTENSGEGTDNVISAVDFTLGANIENLQLAGAALSGTGNALVNIITGTAGANTLNGGAGADTLDGGAGNDLYLVDAGDVIIENAGGGTDTVQSSVSFTLAADLENLVLGGSADIDGTGNAGVNLITGNAGDNTLDGGAGGDTLAGGAGDDRYVVDDAGDVVSENATGGSDTVYSAISYALAANLENLILTSALGIDATGNAVANSLAGNSAANTLDGGAGADTLAGGAGDDTYVVDNAGDVLLEAAGEGTDTVLSSVTFTLGADFENLTLSGTSAVNATGNGLANTLTGNLSANTLNGGTGADVMAGGAGNDTYVVDNASDIVSENAGEGTDTVQSAVSYALGAEVENLVLNGFAALNGTGNAADNALTGNLAANTLDGGAGADTLVGGDGNDVYILDNAGDIAVESAGEGNDTVRASVSVILSSNIENLVLTGAAASNGIGNTLDNSLTGNTGDNTLDGGAGADTMAGGVGNDSYAVDSASDAVIENAGEGTDTVLSSISYALSTQVENLTLTGVGAINATGNGAVNTLAGNSAANTIDGGLGADTMTGGNGNDVYLVDNSLDIVSENAGEGTDTVRAALTFTLGANIENLELTGAAAIDGTGNTLNNTLTGNTNANTLDGGAGTDLLAGGDGNDVYLVDNTGDSISEAAGQGLDTARSSVTYTIGAEVEYLILTGVAAINGTGNAADNALTGNSGDNTLDGGAGGDTLAGGLGNDTYVIDSLFDSVVENAAEGSDTVMTGLSYALTAQVENLTLMGVGAVNGTGNALVNILTGNSSANTLDGGAGADTMTGGNGSDVYLVDDALDIVSENASEGSDTVRASLSFTLSANLESLELSGAAAINGTGNALDNTITGNTNVNTLDGGAGADLLAGGLGDDVYLVDNAGDSVLELTGEGVDTARSSVSYTLGAEVERLVLTGAGAISGTGNGDDNVVTGNTGNNTLDGGAGADTLAGGLGNDVYVVDSAADVVSENAGEGTDTVMAAVTTVLSGNIENLTLTGAAAINGTGNAAVNILVGNAAVNTLDGGLGADTMSGGNGNDFYVVDDVLDVAIEIAGEGVDTVQSALSFTLGANVEILWLTGGGAVNGTGNALDNTITGNTNANTLDGGAGADLLAGGLGNDIYLIDNSGDSIAELSGEGVDTARSTVSYILGAEVEYLVLTGAGVINGTGNGLANSITGNGAVNTLDGAAGADTLAGGIGNDVYLVDDAGDIVSENAGEGTDTVLASVSTALFNNVENLTFTGAGAINGIGNSVANTLTGNAGANTLDGGAGADTMIGGLGNDTFIVDATTDIVSEAAGEGTDTIMSAVTFTISANVESLILTGAAVINGTGNTLNNYIEGNSAANTINGGTGADSMRGGLGNDIYVVDNAGDVIVEFAGEGVDTVQSGVSFTLGAEVEYLTLTGATAINATGNALANILTGNTGVNTLDGGAGADTLIGGTGNDTYLVDNAGDFVSEAAAAGTDTVLSSTSHSLFANVENLTLTGAANIDGYGNSVANTIAGNGGDNLLDGGTANDLLQGNGGNDKLYGGDGLDTLTGGTESDTFVFEAASAYNNIDVVTDFNLGQSDALDISDMLSGYDPLVDALSAFVQIADAGANSTVSIDRDGAGATYGFVQVATLTGITGLTNEDALVASGNLIVT